MASVEVETDGKVLTRQATCGLSMKAQGTTW